MNYTLKPLLGLFWNRTSNDMDMLVVCYVRKFLNVFHCNLLIELGAFTKKLRELESGQKLRIFYH